MKKNRNFSTILTIFIFLLSILSISFFVKSFVSRAAPPVITINTLITNDSTPTLTGTIDSNTSTIKITISGTVYTGVNHQDGTWSADVTNSLDNGIYDVIATATDPVEGISHDSSTNELTIDTVKPTVTINQKSGQNDPTNINSATFTIIFSELINESTFTSSDITLTGTTGTVTGFTKVNNTTWEATVTGMTDGNTVVATISADKFTDLAGNNNTASTSTDNSIKYDITKPTVTINQALSQPDPTNINSAEFTVIFSEPIKESTFTPSDITISGGSGAVTTFTKENDTQWKVIITNMESVSTISASIATNSLTDLAGNNNTASTSTDNSITYDATPPVITIHTVFTQNRSPQLTGNIDDNTASIKINVNGQEYNATNNADGTWTLNAGIISPNLSDGIYDIIAKATDTTGNTGQDSTNNELTVDNIAPIITINQTITNNHNPILVGTINDPDSTIKITVNGKTYTAQYEDSNHWTLTVPDSIPNGTYDIQATATDLAGNIGYDNTTDELIINEYLLTAEITIPSTQRRETNIDYAEFILTFSHDGVVTSTFTQDDLIIEGSSTAIISQFTQIDTKTWKIVISNMTEGDTVNPKLPAGKVQDAFGNYNQLSNQLGYVTYDTTPPVITVNQLITNNNSPQLTGNIDDKNAIVKITVNGVEYSAINNKDGSWTLPDSTIISLPDGIYNIVAKATDLATNIGLDITDNELAVDTERPTVTIEQSASQADPTNTNLALFTIVISKEINESTLVAGDITLSGTTGAVTKLSKINNKTYEIEVTHMSDGDIAKVVIADGRFADPAGNTNTESTSTDNTVTYDITPPTVDISSVYANSLSPEIKGHIDDPSATVKVTVAGKTYIATNNGDGTWILPSGKITPDLSDGEIIISAIATDLANNTSTTAFEKTITIDTIAPTGTMDSIAKDINTSPMLSGTVDDNTAEIFVTINGIKYKAENNKDGTWSIKEGTLLNLTPNTYDIVVAFIDPAGNRTETTSKLTILRADADTPTVDSIKHTGNKPIITGTYDSENSQSLSVTVGGKKYILGIDSELSVNNNNWTLDLSNIETGLVLGLHDIIVEVTTRGGNTISDSTTNELTIIALPRSSAISHHSEESNLEVSEKNETMEENIPPQPENTKEEENLIPITHQKTCLQENNYPILIAIAIVLFLAIILIKKDIISITLIFISIALWYLITKNNCTIVWVWPILYTIESVIGIVIRKTLDKKLRKSNI